MPLRYWVVTVVGFLFLPLLPAAPPPVAPQNQYERVLLVVPMIGRGTPADPKRPLGAPAPNPQAKPTRTGLFAYSYQLSDDGQFAIVEFVANNTSALAPLLTDKLVLKVFQKGKGKKDDIERECRKFKKDFSLDKFGLGIN